VITAATYIIRIAKADIQSLKESFIVNAALIKSKQHYAITVEEMYGKMKHTMRIQVIIFVKNANGSVAAGRIAKALAPAAMRK
jgi:hypothetical protein